MNTGIRIVTAVMWANVAVTAAELSRERAGDYMFTMIGLVLILTAAPYLASRAVMRRVGAGWALAIGIGACVFGAIDVAVRFQAFFFPTGSLNAGLALRLPFYAVGAIPLFSVIARTLLNVFSPDVRER